MITNIFPWCRSLFWKLFCIEKVSAAWKTNDEYTFFSIFSFRKEVSGPVWQLEYQKRQLLFNMAVVCDSDSGSIKRLHILAPCHSIWYWHTDSGRFCSWCVEQLLLADLITLGVLQIGRESRNRSSYCNVCICWQLSSPCCGLWPSVSSNFSVTAWVLLCC